MISTLLNYIQNALASAQYEFDNDLKVWVGHIPELPGTLAQGDTIETTRTQLAEVIEDWILIALQFGDNIPPINGVEIKRVNKRKNTPKLAHA